MLHTHAYGWGRSVATAAITASLVASLAGCGLFGTHEEPATAPAVSETNSSAKVDAATSTGTTMNTMVESEVGLYDYAPVEGGVNFNTEEYSALTEQGFIAAATRPLSTVSSDVDTASYCNLRRMLRDGWTADEIDAGAVRIEEMLNYFHYDYDTPEGDDLFAVTSHVGDCPWNKDTKLVTLGFATRPEDDGIARKGSNLVFLIDISGSMDDSDKLGLLKDAFGKLLDNLGDNDRVSIVTYAAGEDVLLEGAKGSEKSKIMRVINRLRADGSTNGEAGLKMAYQVAQDNFIEGGVNRIILASDGDLNVGISSESDLHDYVDKQRETGIYLSVLGFGSGNYKDNKMETLADHGNGSYHYIDCIEEAERVLGTNLTANLVPLADDVKLQVEFNPAQVKGYRLIGYENRAMADEDFRDDKKDAGDVGPGSQFTVAYEVALVGSDQQVGETDLKYGAPAEGDGSSDEWLTATIRYKPAEGGEVREQTHVVGEASLEKTPHEDWNFQAAVIELGMLLRDSEFKGTSDYDSIRALLAKGGTDKDREGFAELVDLALDYGGDVIE
ncbi:MAG: VWA domain-containing protein [Atopobiaceae bacterium]|nr:VWA domain-containing protein [Atopobiaceae bacterium]